MSVQTQNGKQAAPVTVNLEAKLFTIRYKADTAPHLAIRDQAVCAACERPCETFCPARVYEWQAGEGRMHVAFENCLECGTCRIACPHQNIDWRYPTGGTGIVGGKARDPHQHGMGPRCRVCRPAGMERNSAPENRDDAVRDEARQSSLRIHGKRVTKYVRKRVPVKVVTYARAEPGASCSTHLVSAGRGYADADDAIARTVADGFPRGTAIYLHIERMDAIPKAMRDYYKAWTTRVLADGRFRPAYYAHTHNAEEVYRDVSSIFVTAGIASPPQFWIASAQGFAEDKSPVEVGHSFASVWQGVLDVVQTHNGVKLPIDVNVASVPSPSSHEYAATD